MIKIALKHYIYEKCISILFDFINRNFPIHKVKKYTIDMFHKGDLYDYIKVIRHNDVICLYECRITELHPKYGIIEVAHKKYAEYDKTGNMINENPTPSYMTRRHSLRPEQIIRTS